MTIITIPLPEEDLVFLRAYTEARGTSAEAFLAQQTRNLRERLQRPLSPEVEAVSGIIASGIDGEVEYRAYLEKKYA